MSLLPHQGATVAVKVEGGEGREKQNTLLLESAEPGTPLQVQDSLLRVSHDHLSCVQVFNPTGITCYAEAGSEVGEAREADVVEVEEHPQEHLEEDESEDEQGEAVIRHIALMDPEIETDISTEVIPDDDTEEVRYETPVTLARQQDCYSLRPRVKAPQRLMYVCSSSGSSYSKGESNVANL